MLSSLPNISQSELLKLLGLDETCFKILTYMTLSEAEQFSHNQLRNDMKNEKMEIKEPTFSRHLDHLEKKNVIIRKKTDYKTEIRLNEKGIIPLIIQEPFKPFINNYQDKLDSISKLSTEKLYEELKNNAIQQAYKSLYLRLSNSLDSKREGEKKLLFRWFNLVYDNLIEAYIDELKSRGIPEVHKVIAWHLEQ